MSIDLAMRRCTGSEFHSDAAALSKRRSPYVFVRVDGTLRRNADSERKDLTGYDTRGGVEDLF
jgi:hypothetical protein